MEVGDRIRTGRSWNTMHRAPSSPLKHRDRRSALALRRATRAGRVESIRGARVRAGGSKLIRSTPASVSEKLVHTGRIRELRGIGPGIEAKLRELVETGDIAELHALEVEMEPELVGYGRSLGLSAKRMLGIARALDVDSVAAFKDAVAAGRLTEAVGVGAVTEAKIRAALENEPKAPRGLTLNRSRPLAHALADALGGEVAGPARRFCELVVRARGRLRRRRSRPGHHSLRAAPGDRRRARTKRATRRRADDGRRAGDARRRDAAGFRHRALSSDGLGGVRRGGRAAPRRAGRGIPLRATGTSPTVRPSCARSRSRRRRPDSSSGRTSREISTATRPGRTARRRFTPWRSPPRRAGTSTWRSATTLRTCASFPD